VRLAVIVLGVFLVVLLTAIIIAAIRQIDAGGRH
jgi:hypothetical protein